MTRFNQRGYKFYVVVNGKIESGWEYREDARDQLRELPDPRSGRVLTGTALRARGIDPNDNSAWLTNPIAEAPRGARARRPHVREARPERKISMTYGQIPPFEEFEHDIHTRIDPESGEPYWPEGTLYPMELVSRREIELAEEFGGLDGFRTERQRTGRHSGAYGFRGDERQIYDFLVFLMNQEDAYDGEEDSPGSLASSIMYTLGYEWI